MAEPDRQAAPKAAGVVPAAPGVEEGVRAKRSRLTQAAGAPEVGRRGAQPDPDAPARRCRVLVGLVLSAIVVAAAVVLIMGLAADISL